MKTTVGQLLINDALPTDLRDYSREFNKGSASDVYKQLAQRHPDKYREVAQKLQNIGRHVAQTYGPVSSVSLSDLKPLPSVQIIMSGLHRSIHRILGSPGMSDERKQEEIIKLVGSARDKVEAAVMSEASSRGNSFARQVKAGARGNVVQLTSMLAGDMLVSDHKDRVIPVPMLRSYAEGVSPAEYWAAAYGARKGATSTKFMTPRAGFFGKQIGLAAHRLVVTDKDCGTNNGILVDADDRDNEGTVIMKTYGDVKAGTVLTPSTLKKLKGYGKILIRSPLTCQAKGGVCQKCAGIREKGDFPEIGSNIGMVAAQAIAEPVSQTQLSKKHSGGVAGAGQSVSGFDLINQLVQVPKTFKEETTLSQIDGRVSDVRKAPQGGTFVTVGGIEHWVSPQHQVKVKVGDVVEAGDMLSTGIPNPAAIVKFKGIGEGRRQFVTHFRKALEDNGIRTNRRNIELLSRGLINHVRLVDIDASDNGLPDDVVEYDEIVKGYKPRAGSVTLSPKQAIGKYMETPYLHFSIGTRVTPSVVRTLQNTGVKAVTVHQDKPSFVPEMRRAMESLVHAPNWMTRLGGFYLKKGLTEAVHRGRSADIHGESFIPALAEGAELGNVPGAAY